MKPEALPLSIELTELVCHEQTEGPKGADPYLWNIFFAIDGRGLTITEEFRLEGAARFSFSPGSHRNITSVKVVDGEKVPIPEAVGKWETVLHPMIIPHFHAPITGVVGVLSVLMEKNNLSLKGAEAGHEFLNDFVREAVNNALMGFDPKLIDIYDIEESIGDYFTRKIEVFTAGIDKKLGKAVIKKQSIFRNLWSLIDADDLLGYEIAHFTHDSFHGLESWEIPFSKVIDNPKLGKWELRGVCRRIGED